MCGYDLLVFFSLYLSPLVQGTPYPRDTNCSNLICCIAIFYGSFFSAPGFVCFSWFFSKRHHVQGTHLHLQHNFFFCTKPFFGQGVPESQMTHFLRVTTLLWSVSLSLSLFLLCFCFRPQCPLCTDSGGCECLLRPRRPEWTSGSPNQWCACLILLKGLNQLECIGCMHPRP